MLKHTLFIKNVNIILVILDEYNTLHGALILVNQCHTSTLKNT